MLSGSSTLHAVTGRAHFPSIFRLPDTAGDPTSTHECVEGEKRGGNNADRRQRTDSTPSAAAVAAGGDEKPSPECR